MSWPVGSLTVSVNCGFYNDLYFVFRTKSEPKSDYNDGMETCSQIVYNYNTERPQKVLKIFYYPVLCGLITA